MAPITCLAPVRRWALAVRGWPVSTQEQARRNAMVASTALAHGRAERIEAQRYLDEAAARHAARAARVAAIG